MPHIGAQYAQGPPSGPTVEHTFQLAQRVAKELQQASWRFERMLSDHGNTFGRRAFAAGLPDGLVRTQIGLRAPVRRAAAARARGAEPRGRAQRPTSVASHRFSASQIGDV